MITKVSLISFSAAKTRDNLKQSSVNKSKLVRQGTYVDSFIKQAQESAPTLLALTGLWSLLDYGSGKVSMAKSLKNNIAFFFSFTFNQCAHFSNKNITKFI